MDLPETFNRQTFRLVDSSLNRLAEGLRYLEDVARFLLNDSTLTQRLKLLRHDLVVSEWQFQKDLLSSRDTIGDVGFGIDVDEKENAERDLFSSVIANSRRVQEALRTLEEFSKISRYAKHLTTKKIEQARFNVYEIEKNLISRLLRRDKVTKMRGIYAVIDIQALKGRNHLDVASEVIKGGAKVIQLRDKKLDHGKLLTIARDLQRICSENNILFIVNDFLDIALAAEADGLHVGQTDLPVSIARKLVPLNMIIGCSTDTITQAKQAVASGADYVAVGAMFSTSTKDAKILGISALKKIKRAVTVPVVAIGGINKTNVAEVKSAGADAISVISAVMGATSPRRAVKELKKIFEGEND